MRPKRGMRFKHSRQLSTEGNERGPLLCEVTRVARGVVYYRGVYAVGTADEHKGGAFYIGADKLDTIVLEWLQ